MHPPAREYDKKNGFQCHGTTPDEQFTQKRKTKTLQHWRHSVRKRKMPTLKSIMNTDHTITGLLQKRPNTSTYIICALILA